MKRHYPAATAVSPGAHVRVGYVLLFVAAILFHGRYACHGLAMFDTGMLVADVDRVLRGEVFGRDFMAPYGPGRYYLLALVFKLFGASLLTLAWTFAALRALLDLLTYHLARHFLPPLPALLPVFLVGMAHGSLHKSFLALSSLLVLLALVAFTRRQGRAAAMAVGSAAGIAFLLRYDAGVFGAVASCVTFAACGLARRVLWPVLGRQAIFACLAALGLVGIAGGLLLASGMRPTWWWEMVWHRISIQEGIDHPFPWPLASLRAGQKFAALTGVYLLAAPLVFAVGAAQAWRWCRRPDKREQGGALAGVVTMGVFLLNQARLVPTFNHFLQGAAPLFVVGASALWAALSRLRARGGWSRELANSIFLLPAGVIALHVVLGTHGTHPGSFTVREETDRLLAVPRARIFVPPHQASEVQRVLDLIGARTNADESIVCSHSCPAFYFLSGRLPALPFSEPSYYYRNDAVQRDLVARLERSPPRLFIYDPNPVVGYSMDADAPILLEALSSSMRPVAQIGSYIIYERARE
ncbi:MAG: hypothetical protein AB1486_30345 [Planctomycetota bacterium]